MPAPHPRMHGLTHVPGGPDPIPGIQMQAAKFDEIILAQPSLLGYWPLYDDDATFDRTPDYSSSGHHLTVYGSVGFTGATGADQTGAALDSPSGFGSGGDYLQDNVSPSNLYYFNGTAPYTFTITILPSTLPAATVPIDWGVMVVYGYPSGSLGGMRISLVSPTTNNACIRVSRAGSVYTGPVLYSVDPDDPDTLELPPVMVTVTYDGATLKLYYDAALAGSWADTGSHGASGELTLGQYYSGSYYSNFNGNLMQAAVFNDALAESVIDALKKASDVELSKQVDSIQIEDGVKLTGDVKLAGDTGVTLSRSGNTISFAGGGGGGITSIGDTTPSTLTGMLRGNGTDIDVATPAQVLAATGLGKSARTYQLGFPITSATLTTVPFTGERWDNDGIYDNAAAPTRLVCRTAGIYLLAAYVYWPVNGTGFRQTRIRANGVSELATNSSPANAANGSEMTPNTIWQLAVNDYIEVVVYQDSGGALSVGAELMLARVG